LNKTLCREITEIAEIRAQSVSVWFLDGMASSLFRFLNQPGLEPTLRKPGQ
jgi:hypothetical protein